MASLRFLQRNLVTIDGLAGLSAGVAMLALSGRLPDWYNLSFKLVLAVALTNLAYGTYSFTLSRRSVIPPGAISFLSVANMLWGLVCVVLAAYHWDLASLLGRIALLAEGAFVGGLGLLEWRWRSLLVRR